MSTTSRVAGAVAAGYVLGRFKKLRMAVLVASAMSSPKFRNAAAEMIQSRIPGGAIVGGLTREVGGRLFDAGKVAATSLVASRIDTLSQNLADRSDTLRKSGPSRPARPSRAEEPAEDQEQPEDEYEEQGEESEQPEDEYEEQDEESEQPEDEYEEQDEESEQPEDEYEEQDEESEQPEDEYEEQDEESKQPEDESADEEEPVARSPRRRRSASPAGRRRG